MGTTFEPTRAEFGKEAEYKVCNRLNEASAKRYGGRLIAVIPDKIIKTNKDARGQYDLEVFLEDYPEIRLINEVKRRSEKYHFTKADDFPYSTVQIDSKSTFDNKLKTPYLYTIVNWDLQAAFSFSVDSSRSKWTERRYYHEAKGQWDDGYDCPKSEGLTFEDSFELMYWQLITITETSDW